MELTVLENFLPKSYLKEVNDLLLGEDLTWYHYAQTVLTPDLHRSSTVEHPFFNHAFYHHGNSLSPYASLVIPIVFLLEKELGIDIAEIVRIKANKMIQILGYPEDSHASIHRDTTLGPGQVSGDFVTMLLYLNDSDGDTFFFDDTGEISQRMTPKANTAVLFNSDTLHAASPPREYTERVAINFILRLDK